jgi:hypothetical protein
MVGTLEDAVMMDRNKRRLEEFNELELKYLPKGIRLDIPLKSATHMRRIGVLLVEFGEAMQRMSQRKDLTSYQVLENLWFIARKVRREIERICYPLRHNGSN